MNAKKFYLLIGIVLMVGLLPQKIASADMGPKPTMEFEFVQEVPGQALTMVSWHLINCRHYDCKELGDDLPDIVPFPLNNFKCANNHCDAHVYYNTNEKYFQMEITFSDGKTRTSNVFTRKYFDAKYKVNIGSDSLYVEELRGSNLQIVQTIFVVIYELVAYEGFGPPIVGIILIVLVVIVVYTKFRKDAREKLLMRLANVFLWLLIATLSVTGLILSWKTFTLTLLIECILAILYLNYLKSPIWRVLCGVFVANIFTQPIFTGISMSLYSPSDFTITAVLEIIIWLVEVVIVNKVQNKQLPFKNILVLTFILNAASFGIGLLLPI